VDAHEINGLFEQESPAALLYVKLTELGVRVERNWLVSQERIAWVVDPALPVGDGWLLVTFGDRPGPTEGVRFAAEVEPEACLRETQARLQAS
jgi:hypothetical protein